MTGSRACSLRFRRGLAHPGGLAQILNKKMWINTNATVLSFAVEGREEDMDVGTKGMIFRECRLRE